MNSSAKKFTQLAGMGCLAIAIGFGVRALMASKAQKQSTSVVNPKDVEANAKLATILGKLKANPKDLQSHKDLAAVFLERNLPLKAARELSFVLKADANDNEARLKLADTFLGAKQYAAAETLFRDLTIRLPNSLPAWQGLTATLEKEGRHLEAMHVVRRCLALDPNGPSTHLLMAKAALEYAVQFPNPENHGGELDFARKEFEGLAKAVPNSPEIRYNLGRAYVGLHDKTNGVATLLKAHELAPRNQEFGQMLVIVYRAMNNQADALKVTRELLSYDPENTATNDLFGQIILQSKEAGKEEKAVNAFAKSVKSDPNSPLFLQHLADAQILTGDLKSAKDNLERAVRVNPNNPYPYQRLALVYTRLGDRVKSKVAAATGKGMENNEMQLRRLQDISQKHPENVNIHLALADRYRDLRRMNPARDEYLLVLKLDPSNKRVPKALIDASKVFDATK